jgi:multicomponent Na+:H+ antiporter subunit E
MPLWNVLLALIWASLNGEFSLTNLLAGFVLGYAVLWLMQAVIGQSTYFTKMGQGLELALFFLKELIVANFSVAYYVLAPRDRMRPAVQAIPLEPAKDISITLLANMITLTPGTLSLDVSPDRKYLFIHNIAVTDLEQSRKQIKETFERRILEVTL